MTGFRSQVARIKRKDQGLEAELRVGDQLGHLGKIRHGAPGASGENGEPDLILETPSQDGRLPGPRYALEVKSMLPYHSRAKTEKRASSREPGRINLVPEAWEIMATWAISHGLIPALVVEVRIRTYPNLYHWISDKNVDKWIRRSPEAKMVHMGLYDLPLLSKYSWRPGILESVQLEYL